MLTVDSSQNLSDHCQKIQKCLWGQIGGFPCVERGKNTSHVGALLAAVACPLAIPIGEEPGGGEVTNQHSRTILVQFPPRCCVLPFHRPTGHTVVTHLPPRGILPADRAAKHIENAPARNLPACHAARAGVVLLPPVVQAHSGHSQPADSFRWPSRLCRSRSTATMCPQRSAPFHVWNSSMN